MTTATLGRAAVEVLGCGDAMAKASRSREAAAAWRAGMLRPLCDVPPPLRPARPPRPELRDPARMPKRGKGGSIARRIALLHALTHIELNAIDLAWDLVARFGAGMPRDFLDDWVGVADDEARHFLLLSDRLATYGVVYGDLPAHDGLWQAATRTAHDLAARLAVVPLVLEARGLDVTPPMIERLKCAGDAESAAVLETIHADEISHVARGKRWFDHLCEGANRDPVLCFQSLVRRYFAPSLKPPFNDEARHAAGLESAFYRPLGAEQR